MNSSKGGADVIAFVLLLVFAIITSVFLVLMIGEPDRIDVDQELAEMSDKQVSYSSLHRVMNSEVSNYEESEYGKYGDRKVYELISLYYSFNDREEVRVGDLYFEREVVKEDIESILESEAEDISLSRRLNYEEKSIVVRGPENIEAGAEGTEVKSIYRVPYNQGSLEVVALGDQR